MPNKSTGTTIPRGDLYGSLEEAPRQQNLIGTSLLPPMKTPLKTGSFGVIPMEAMITLPASIKRSPKTGYARGDWTFESLSYACDEYGWEEVSDDGEARNYANYFDYQAVLAGRGNTIVDLMQEKRVMSLLHNTTTFPLSGNTGKSVSVEWDTSTADILGDINDGIAGVRARSGLVPDTLQVAFNTWRDMWVNAGIRGAVQYVMQANIPSPDDLGARTEMARIVGLRNPIEVAYAYSNTAAEGQTPTPSDVWDDEYAVLLLKGIPENVQAAGAGHTFYWDEDGGLKAVEEYREDRTRGGVIRVRQVVQEKLKFPEVVYLFGNIHT